MDLLDLSVGEDVQAPSFKWTGQAVERDERHVWVRWNHDRSNPYQYSLQWVRVALESGFLTKGQPEDFL